MKMMITDADVVQTIRDAAWMLDGADDVAPFLPLIGEAEVVMLGEATHGT